MNYTKGNCIGEWTCTEIKKTGTGKTSIWRCEDKSMYLSVALGYSGEPTNVYCHWAQKTFSGNRRPMTTRLMNANDFLLILREWCKDDCIFDITNPCNFTFWKRRIPSAHRIPLFSIEEYSFVLSVMLSAYWEFANDCIRKSVR